MSCNFSSTESSGESVICCRQVLKKTMSFMSFLLEVQISFMFDLLDTTLNIASFIKILARLRLNRLIGSDPESRMSPDRSLIEIRPNITLPAEADVENQWRSQRSCWTCFHCSGFEIWDSRISNMFGRFDLISSISIIGIMDRKLGGRADNS